MANFLLSFDFENSYDASFHAIFGSQATKFGLKLAEQVGDPDEIKSLKQTLRNLETEISSAFPAAIKSREAELRRLRKIIFKDKTLTNDARRTKQKALNKKFADVTAAKKVRSALYRKRRETQRRLERLTLSGGVGGGSFQSFADPISFLHSISWQVVEPMRLKQVRHNLKEVTRLNRETWRLARAEKDNDREWLPNAKQTSPFETLKVTDETIDTWLAAVAAMEKVLDGELMAPTWRFGRGMNVKRFLEEAKSFDLILFLTGPNSIEFVEKGPMLDQNMMHSLNNPFGRNFNSYALWFN